jgi:Fe-S-cluster containining protein
MILTKDIKALAQLTGHTSHDFKIEFIEKDEDGDMHFKYLPCPFLRDKKCNVYDSRPDDYKSYPHLHKKDFLSRLLGVIDNYLNCPIVFNVFEELKLKFHFR